MKSKMRKVIGFIFVVIAFMIIIGNVVLLIVSEKNTIKGEKSKVKVNKEEKIVHIHTGAIAFNSMKWTSDSVDGGYVFDKKHPNRGIYGEYNFVNILNGEEIKKVNYNKIKRSDDLYIYLDIEPFNVDADKKLKDVDITIELVGRCDLKHFSKDLDVDFIFKDEGSVNNEIINRNDSMEYHITDIDELGSYVIRILSFEQELIHWAFDIKITDNSIYEKK